jgi:hypothetical protein
MSKECVTFVWTALAESAEIVQQIVKLAQYIRLEVYTS